VENKLAIGMIIGMVLVGIGANYIYSTPALLDLFIIMCLIALISLAILFLKANGDI
jgi:hypothetical protein